MTRSRLVVVIAAAVVAAGIAAALVAFWLDPARAAIGPLPGQALVLPSESAFVAGLDVKRFVASHLYATLGRGGAWRPQALAALEAQTGISLERDVERLVLAGGKDASGVVALAFGRFDRASLTTALGRTGEPRTVHGVAVYRLGVANAAEPGAVALLDDRTVVSGTATAVERTLAARADANLGLRGNQPLVDLIARVKPGAMFWIAGDRALLSQLPRGIPAPGGGTNEFRLPALEGLLLTADVEPVVAVDATGITADAAAADNLASMLRGGVALLKLQAGQKPQLAELVQAISITTEKEQVHVSGRFAYALVESMIGGGTRPTPAAP